MSKGISINSTLNEKSEKGDHKITCGNGVLLKLRKLSTKIFKGIITKHPVVHISGMWMTEIQKCLGCQLTSITGPGKNTLKA